MDGNTTEISVVIPVYMAEHCLEELYLRLTKALVKVSGKYEIVFVEDAGPDLSWEFIEKLVKNDRRIHGIQFTRNLGL